MKLEDYFAGFLFLMMMCMATFYVMHPGLSLPDIDLDTYLQLAD